MTNWTFLNHTSPEKPSMVSSQDLNMLEKPLWPSMLLNISDLSWLTGKPFLPRSRKNQLQPLSLLKKSPTTMLKLIWLINSILPRPVAPSYLMVSHTPTTNCRFWWRRLDFQHLWFILRLINHTWLRDSESEKARKLKVRWMKRLTTNLRESLQKATNSNNCS